MPPAAPVLTVELAIDRELSGVLVVGTSTVGNTDKVAGIFGSNTYDSIPTSSGGGTNDYWVKKVEITRGRNPDTFQMEGSTGRVTLHDPHGVFNPQAKLYEDEVLDDSPVGYWRLGESSGATSAVDESGNGLNGTYTGGVTLGQTGALSGDTDTAALFDGSTGYVSVPHNSVFDFGAGSYTIEAWVKFNSLGAFRVVVGKGSTGATGGWLAFITNTNKLRLFNNGDSAGYPASTISVPDTGWHHLVWGYDTAAGQVFYQIDGTREAITAANVSVGQAVALTIGTGTTFAPYRVAGTLDEVAIYPTALSAARILAHYEAGTRYLAKKLKRLIPIRVRADYTGATRPGRFHGFVSRSEHNPHPSAQETILECVDLTEWLATQFPVIAATGPTTVGAAFGLILDAVGWTDPAFRDLDTGRSLADFSMDGTESAQAKGNALLQYDRGAAFQYGDGVFTFQEGSSRWARQTPAFAFTGSVLTGAKFAWDVANVVNRQKVTKTGGVEQEAEDDESRRLNSYRDGTAITSDYLASDAEALSLARWVVTLGAMGRPPIRQVSLVNRSEAILLEQLSRDIGDFGAVTESTRSNTSYEGTIEAVQETHEPGGVLRSRFLVPEKPVSALTVGVSTVGNRDVVYW